MTRIITPRTCTRGKVIGLVVVVVVVVSTKIAKSQRIGIWQSALCHQTVDSHKNYLLFALNRLERLMSTTNCAFSLAMPIDHTYQCHVVFPLRMPELKISKGH